MTKGLNVLRTIRPKVTARQIVTVVALVLAWCGLWGDLSVANIVAGAVVASGALATGTGVSNKGTVRLVPMAQLLGIVLIDLIASTYEVAKEIVRPSTTVSEAIVAVELPSPAKQHFLLLIVAITLTPGTAVVDADPHTGTLYLHLLQHRRTDDVRVHVAKLADLTCRALPLPLNATKGIKL